MSSYDSTHLILQDTSTEPTTSTDSAGASSGGTNEGDGTDGG